MKKYLLLLLNFVPLVATSQSKIINGYVVSIKGDTLRGNIDFSELETIKPQIFLGGIKSDSVIAFNVNNCLGFGINGQKEFRTKRVAINLIKVESDKSNWDILPEKAYFLEILEKGEITLYKYKSSKEISLYFIETNFSQLEQLIYHTYYKDNKGSIGENKYYQNQLFLASKKKFLKADRLNYDEASIDKFIAEYNNVSDVKKIKKVFIQIGTGLAYYPTFDILTATFKSSLSPALSAEVVFPLEKKYNSLLFILGFNYSFHNPIKTPNSSLSSFADHYSIYTNNFLASIGAVYMPFKDKKIRPFIGLGLGPNEPFGSYIKTNNGTKIKTNTNKNSYNGEFIFTKHATRIYYKAGIHISNKLKIEIRYDDIPFYSRNQKGSNVKIYNFLVHRRL